MGIAGIGYGGMMTIPSSILADVIDLDELRTGERREGLYFGTWDFIRKLCSNLGKWGPMMGLAMLGYSAASPIQTEELRTGVRMMFTLGPAAIYLIAGLVMLAFPMSREEHGRIRQELEAKRKRRTAS
jgi:Na+/melibiose symporter-like transporter